MAGTSMEMEKHSKAQNCIAMEQRRSVWKRKGKAQMGVEWNSTEKPR